MAGTIQFSQLYGGESNVSNAIMPSPAEADINKASSPFLNDHRATVALVALIALFVGIRLMWESAE